jgi:site-specific recombinase XerD
VIGRGGASLDDLEALYHTLRHVFASELLHAGANLRQIQDLLGHKHLDSTQRYTRVNAHELRSAIKRLRWVGGRP